MAFVYSRHCKKKKQSFTTVKNKLSYFLTTTFKNSYKTEQLFLADSQVSDIFCIHCVGSQELGSPVNGVNIFVSIQHY